MYRLLLSQGDLIIPLGVQLSCLLLQLSKLYFHILLLRLAVLSSVPLLLCVVTDEAGIKVSTPLAPILESFLLSCTELI